MTDLNLLVNFTTRNLLYNTKLRSAARLPDLAHGGGTLLDGELAGGDWRAVARRVAGVQHVGEVVVQASAARACSSVEVFKIIQFKTDFVWDSFQYFDF
jgi:hypothetical protein